MAVLVHNMCMPKKVSKKTAENAKSISTKMAEREEQVAQSIKETDEMIKQISDNGLTEFLRAFKEKKHQKKVPEIKRAFPLFVKMWRRGQDDMEATLFANVDPNNWKTYVRMYDTWARRRSSIPHDPNNNPVRVVKRAVRKMEEEALLRVAERKATAVSHTGLVQLKKFRAEKDATKVDVPKRVKEVPKNSKIKVNLDSIKVSASDVRKVESSFKPVSLRSGLMVDQMKKISEDAQNKK